MGSLKFDPLHQGYKTDFFDIIEKQLGHSDHRMHFWWVLGWRDMNIMLNEEPF